MRFQRNNREWGLPNGYSESMSSGARPFAFSFFRFSFFFVLDKVNCEAREDAL